MPYEKEKFYIKKPSPAYNFLMEELSISMKEAQSLIDRFRLYKNGECVREKNAKLSGEVELIVYKPQSRGLKPCYEEKDFVIFDKPSGLLVHPTSRDCDYCLYDEILINCGKNAHIAHRLDRQTSGLILVAKNKKAEAKLKTLFEKREIKKTYLCMARGQINEAFCVDAPLKLNEDLHEIKLRMLVDKDGKQSQTEFYPLKYFSDINASLLKVKPKTGRQHQIRVHLFHVKHAIIGDTLYGTSFENARDFLDGKFTQEECKKIFGANRLLLHAQSLSFSYNGKDYHFESKKDIEKEFYDLAKG